ncbi:MAG: hypothetical protein RLZZ292_377 [Bacteroidota bacterium]
MSVTSNKEFYPFINKTTPIYVSYLIIQIHNSYLTNKQHYQLFCDTQLNLPLFMQAWWLDAVCGGTENWEVALSKDKSGKIIGALPYFNTRLKRLIPAIFTPALTPFSGIWLDYPREMTKMEAKISWEHRVLNELIEQLPNKPMFEQRYAPTLTNWLPFYWKGFQQTTRYTYVLEDLSNLEEVWSAMKDKLRNTIRKAEKLVSIEKIDVMDAQAILFFYQLNQKTFQRQGIKMHYTLPFIQKIDAVLAHRGQRAIYFAQDINSSITCYHAAIYVVWDKKTAYCLMIGGDTALRSSGAISLLLWRAIQDMAKKGIAFDFEGSMLPNVEPMYRAFGATQKPYLQLSKERNVFYTLLKFFLLK